MTKSVCFLFGFIFLFQSSIVFSVGEQRNAQPQSAKGEYQRTLNLQNQIHSFIRAAGQYEKKGQAQLALASYLKAYAINQCAGLIAVCRGGLADNYEKLGEYEKALEHINWFLNGLNPSEPIYKKMISAKSRLLKKIEEQKQGKDPLVEQIKQNFSNVGPERQKQFLESLGGQGMFEDFKKAVLLEHSGQYKEALIAYENLLSQKEAISKQMGLDAWVMLYPAIQRNSELSGNRIKEKEALVWIRENILAPQGTYHSSLPKLEPGIVAHLKSRIRSAVEKSDQ